MFAVVNCVKKTRKPMTALKEICDIFITPIIAPRRENDQAPSCIPATPHAHGSRASMSEDQRPLCDYAAPHVPSVSPRFLTIQRVLSRPHAQDLL